MWVQNQRNSWHGVDFPYHSDLDVREYLRRYYQTLTSVDDSLGRILVFLEENGLTETTAILFMGDNGFLFGEHGLIDKRNAYEESMRVPFLAYGPGLFPSGTVVEALAANLDIAPTVLELAGIENMPEQFEGVSLLSLGNATAGEMMTGTGREEFLYGARLFWHTWDLFYGFSKAAIFGLIIPLISVHMGLRTTGGAAGVGLQTTRAVMFMILTILIIDAMFPPLLLE